MSNKKTLKRNKRNSKRGKSRKGGFFGLFKDKHNEQNPQCNPNNLVNLTSTFDIKKKIDTFQIIHSITSYNASSDNVTTRDDINYNRRVAFIKNIKNERLSPADRLSPSIYEIISTIVNDSEEEDDIEIRNIKIGKYSTTLDKLTIF